MKYLNPLLSRKSTSGFRFGDCAHLRSRKSIRMPNFGKTSQSTAKIKLLPVSENGRPPYWISITGLNVYLIFVMRASCCIDLQNFATIEPPSAEL